MAPATREQFIDWQCRLRKAAMRLEGGRPTRGMCPSVTRLDDSIVAAAVIVLLQEKDPGPSSDQFRHIVRKTHDPRERYEAGLQVLSSAHYQYPEDFSDILTALFSADSIIGAELARAGRCVLHFEQHGRRYRIPCAVGQLAEPDPAFQVTYWHNCLFNPHPPRAVRILAFVPEWEEATTTNSS